MRIPTDEDFRQLSEWGLIADPFAAVADYSDAKREARWDNDRHCREHEAYETAREEGDSGVSQEYYRSMERPIDRRKWEYLKRRKAWYIPPIGWGRFAAPETARILDLGCGDGDVTQRIADFVAGRWRQSGYDGAPLEIVGVDLNESRIRNARKLTNSPHSKITLSFQTGDVTRGLDFENEYFDHVISTGVIEVFEGSLFEQFLDEVYRLTWDSLYLQDVLDEFPGSHVRPELDERLESAGFRIDRQEKVLQEPFVESGTKDPLHIWPMLLNQILVARKDDSGPYEDRW
jgi:SAM-dependent methyltransferase